MLYILKSDPKGFGVVVASVDKVKLFRRGQPGRPGRKRWAYLVVWDRLSLPLWTFLATHGEIGKKVGLFAADERDWPAKSDQRRTDQKRVRGTVDLVRVPMKE
jgi:hypothetical protein